MFQKPETNGTGKCGNDWQWPFKESAVYYHVTQHKQTSFMQYRLYIFTINIYILIIIINLRPGKWKRWCSFSLKYTIDKHAVFAIADHIECRAFIIDFQMSPGNKTGMSHIYINFTPAAVSSNGNPVLSDHIFEFPSF